MTRLVAVSEAPTQYHVDVFRRLRAALEGDFVVVYGSLGQTMGMSYPSWGNQVIHNTTGMLDGYPSEVAPEHGPLDLARALRRAGVSRDSAVLFHAILPRFSRNAAIAARALGARLLFRGSANQAPGRSVGHWLRRARDRLALSVFHGFCATGTTTWRYYQSLGRKPIVFSPYCSDEYVLDEFASRYDSIRRDARAEHDIDASEFIVAYCGRFIPLKNVGRLIRAAHAVEQNTDAELRLVIAGDGPDKADVHAAVDGLRWTRRPLLLGFQDRRAIGRLLSAADALALPSSHETWGVVVNEAQRLRNVCLVTEGVSCAPDLIREGGNGTVVDPGSIASISAGLARLIEISERGDHLRINRDLCEMFSARNAALGILEAAGIETDGVHPGRPPGLEGGSR